MTTRSFENPEEKRRAAQKEGPAAPESAKGAEGPPPRAHPGFATTALGAGDVRDTPQIKTEPSGGGEPEDPWLGRVLSGVYEVNRKIGEGGMGAVYSARHVHLSKSYAVKVLTGSVAANSNAVERLKQEAIAASSIEHDNIVDVLSFDRYTDGSVFIVMELLKGESLSDRIARGAMDLHRVLPIAHQICSALGAAHAKGIVHRDLKPENVFITKRGDFERVKVLDFGISKVRSADAEQVRMTRTGQLVGTPLYMSPEQARGEPDIDLRVDVYALGVMLYEMLSGSPPFDGRNYFELLWKHGNEPPQPLRERNPNKFIPEEVDAVVLRALAKQREDRFASMEELAAALVSAAPDVPIPMGPVSLPPSMVSAESSTSGEGAAVVIKAATTTGAGRARPNAVTEDLPVAPPTSGLPAWVYAAGAALVLGLLAAGAMSMAGPAVPGGAPLTEDVDPPDPVVADPVVADPVAVEPAPEVEPLGVEPPAPSGPTLVTVAIDSHPSGAEVRSGDTVLGTTPFFADLPSGVAVTLEFERDDYFVSHEEITPSEGAQIEVRLRRRRRASGDDPSSLHIKTEH